jgi:hypothetical protein
MTARIYPSQQDTNLTAKGSLILTISSNINRVRVFVNNNLTNNESSTVDGLYFYTINIGDIIIIDPTSVTLINVIRKDYTTDDINGDNGIRNTTITGVTSTSYTFTATTVNSVYNFEYLISVGTFPDTPTPTPTTTPLPPTSTPTPTITPTPTGPTPSPTPLPLPSSPLFYYDPGNIASYPGSGSVLYDLSGNGRNANINAGINWVSGSAAYFNLNGNDNNSITGTTLSQTYTSWSMWMGVYRNDQGSSPSGYDGFMYERTGASDGNGLGTFANGNQLDITVNNGTEIYQSFPGTMTTGSWMFIGGAIDNTTYTAQVYTSGSVSPFVSGSKSAGSSNFNNAIVLGEDKEAGQDRTMNGRIGPVLMYDRKLSTTDLTQINDYFKTRYGI